jgi:sugar lactone lactonase YvrE
MGKPVASLLLAALLTGPAACASGGPVGPVGRAPAVGETVVFPAPPDPPRIQFLLALASSWDVTGERPRDSWLSRLTGEEEEERLLHLIQKPYGMALHDDRLFVCDAYLRGFVRIDLVARTFEPIKPAGQGTLDVPINCDVDPVRGNLLVTDTGRDQVVVLDLDGAYRTAFALPEGGRPSDLVVHGNEVWVADMAGAAVHVYDAGTFALLRSFPGEGAQEGEFETRILRPINLDVSERGFYLTDMGDFHAKAFTLDGTHRWSVGGVGQIPGSFGRPKGVAVDSAGRMYVVDAAFENVQIFNDEGQLLMFFGGPYSGLGTMYLPAQVRIYSEGIDFFRSYLDPRFGLDAVIFVTNQYGPDKVSVYGLIHPLEETGEAPGS